MSRERFSDQSPGRLVPITLRKRRMTSSGVTEFDPLPAVSFIPDPLPPRVDWRAMKADLFEVLAGAWAALERVNGLVPLAPNSRILRQALWLREARLSSEIENIHTTALDMVLAGSGEARGDRDKGLEAWNAFKAVRQGLDSDLPFSGRLIKDMHRELLVGVRGEDKRPGEFRDMPVYIGSEARPDQARYVPPPPGEVPGCMGHLEKFANSEWPDIPAIVCIALTHYQFEAIHPFRDGNGRIGRALILHQLCSRKLLDLPVVSVSGHFQRHRQEYVDRMFAVSTEGAWTEWVRFFAEAVATQSVQTRVLAERLIRIHRHHTESLRARSAPARLFTLLDHVFDSPVVSARRVSELLHVTDPTARKDIATFEDLGILRLTDQVAHGRMWYAPAVLDVVEASDLDADPD